MNVELYKLLDSAKITNYDQADMGEPGTLYIQPMEVPINAPGNIWGTKKSSTYGGGPYRQSQKARYAYTMERPKEVPLETLSTPPSERSNRRASDEMHV